MDYKEIKQLEDKHNIWNKSQLTKRVKVKITKTNIKGLMKVFKQMDKDNINTNEIAIK